MKFSNSYSQLDNVFYQRTSPAQVSRPQLLLWNQELADQLLLTGDFCRDKALLAQYFSGNRILEGADPIAQAYAGHQFGSFNPQLGDGRAHLLGEVLSDNGLRYDIQLKGSGQTRFSRQGDGKCAIGPAVREYIMSEAMYALGVPSSRCLAVTATGDLVFRETAKPGAVVTRVAASHIRVGTFEYFAARGDLESLEALTGFAINRHFPEITLNSDLDRSQRVLHFLSAVIDKQITLIVNWLRVGFIHGVMNTDNTAISGETIDFGPCAMMGIYHPGTVFSSIDTRGRYAFGNQAAIGQWNMARLAEALLPLIDEIPEKAVALAEPLIRQFSRDFEQAYQLMLANKLGMASLTAQSNEQAGGPTASLAEDLLAQMQEQELDYTQTFARLTLSLENAEEAAKLSHELGPWYGKWRTLLTDEGITADTAKSLMADTNPVVIPRNHHVEAILTEYEQSGDSREIDDFLTVLRTPYKLLPQTQKFQDLPADGDRHYRTFCGT
ncbi:protein adenylyltransferase SelO [Thalassomonas actiniarum]|uniref:Protein nucleotidyltransferase YdiU n=1 Tax=Thalassomonas actiniarum TaxID=485447 RepID=A0AAE9YSY0_9GAMM|nr:YdiU family protein [Thalassomonas actiniarum]WDD98996.1 YdiU family protein [Thalassomonas actiniarum]